MSAAESVSRASFSGALLPISQPRPMVVLPSAIWADGEWTRIKLGYRARGMDEKWNIFMENDVLFLHRSWTGHGIYEVSFAAVEGGGRRIAEGVVESDPERHRTGADTVDHEYDGLMVELVIRTILLGKAAPELFEKFGELAKQRTGRSDLPTGALRHHALGVRTEN
ncbi:hypothetical protein ACFWYW_28580 [Nonomuraea sp. NPDC059023]|uniref:hypothetical protein n=1 Tax=unclassified Nonomuraea TaxID=2593643 RepID=UPI0036758B95